MSFSSESSENLEECNKGPANLQGDASNCINRSAHFLWPRDSKKKKNHIVVLFCWEGLNSLYHLPRSSTENHKQFQKNIFSPLVPRAEFLYKEIDYLKPFLIKVVKDIFFSVLKCTNTMYLVKEICILFTSPSANCTRWGVYFPAGNLDQLFVLHF